MNDWILIKDKLPYGVGKNERPCENLIMTMKDGRLAYGWINGSNVYAVTEESDEIVIYEISDVLAYMRFPKPYTA